jgi:hypothetical protein
MRWFILAEIAGFGLVEKKDFDGIFGYKAQAGR